MDRREMVGALSAGAAGLVALGGGAAFAGGPGQGHGQGEAKRREHARGGDHDLLDECARICNETATHCLHQAHQAGVAGGRAQGENVHVRVHQATLDCQAFCHLTSALAARASEMAPYAHQACADACRDCAQACEKGRDLDEQMRRCAEICRRCEQHCRRHIRRGDRGRGD